MIEAAGEVWATCGNPGLLWMKKRKGEEEEEEIKGKRKRCEKGQSNRKRKE